MATDNSPDPPQAVVLPAWTLASTVTLLVFLLANIFTVRPVFFPVRMPGTTGHGNVFRLRIDYSTAPLVGALFLVALGPALQALSPSLLKSAVIGSAADLQPWQVLVLFFSMAYLCISLDLTGMLRYLSLVMLRLSGTSGRRLLVAVFLLTSVLTVFSSNDIVVLTLSPLLLHMSKHSHINPLPYLYTCFFAANSMSMIWFLGNSTNTVVAMAFNLNPIQFSAVMGPVTFVAHMIGFAATAWYFKDEIPVEVHSAHAADPDASTSPRDSIIDLTGGIFLSVLTITCMALLFVAGFAQMPVWAVTLVAAGVALARDVVADVYDPEFTVDPQHRGAGQRRASQLESDTESVKSLSMHDEHAHRGGTSRHHTAGESSSRSAAHSPFHHPPSAASSDPNLGIHLADLSLVDKHMQGCSLLEDNLPIPSPPTRPSTPTSPSTGASSLSSRFPRLALATSRIPFAVLPFLVGQFAMVTALDATGVLTHLAHLLALACHPGGPMVAAPFITLVATLGCMGMSNLPMTVLLTKAIANPAFQTVAGHGGAGDAVAAAAAASAATMKAAQYAIVVGSNLGPCLALPGCLAGLIWAESLVSNGVPMRAGMFAKVGMACMSGSLVMGGVVVGAMCLA